MLSSIISNIIDIIMISETKLDNLFHVINFLFKFFQTQISLTNHMRGSILLCVREDKSFSKVEYKHIKVKIEALFYRNKASKKEVAHMLLL